MFRQNCLYLVSFINVLTVFIFSFFRWWLRRWFTPPAAGTWNHCRSSSANHRHLCDRPLCREAPQNHLKWGTTLTLSIYRIVTYGRGLLLHMSHISWSMCVLGTRMSCAKRRNQSWASFDGSIMWVKENACYVQNSPWTETLLRGLCGLLSNYYLLHVYL